LNQIEQKRAAAVRAAAEVENDMVVGLGSGTTAAFAIAALRDRMADGLRIVGIATSEKTAALARAYGIPLTDFSDHRTIHITIDGADAVFRHDLTLIKGLGGALLREKIVAKASDRMIVVVDESKMADSLGAYATLPVEILPFGWQVTCDRLKAMGCRPRLRMAAALPFTTDNGNYIADCSMNQSAAPAALEAKLAAIPGVVESGLFVGLASMVLVGHQTGVEVIER
jgi:ribose 5-phosphate isomerase A